MPSGVRRIAGAQSLSRVCLPFAFLLTIRPSSHTTYASPNGPYRHPLSPRTSLARRCLVHDELRSSGACGGGQHQNELLFWLSELEQGTWPPRKYPYSE